MHPPPPGVSIGLGYLGYGSGAVIMMPIEAILFSGDSDRIGRFGGVHNNSHGVRTGMTFSNDSLAFESKSQLTSICMSVCVHAMDLPPAWSQACICGRVFSVPQAFSCHKCSCPKLKKRFSSTLERAKEVWPGQSRKRRKVSNYEGKHPLQNVLFTHQHVH